MNRSIIGVITVRSINANTVIWDALIWVTLQQLVQSKLQNKAQEFITRTNSGYNYIVNNSVGMNMRTNLLVSYQLYGKVVGMTVIVMTINMISRFCYLIMVITPT